MSNNDHQIIAASTSQASAQDDQEDEQIIRDIHALTPPHPPPNRGRQAWETNSHRSSNLSMASAEGTASTDQNFTTMSREFSALVLAGSTIGHNSSSHGNYSDHSINNYEGGNSNNNHNYNNNNNHLGRIGEDDLMMEENPLAIVTDSNPMDPVPSPRRGSGRGNYNNNTGGGGSSSSGMVGGGQINDQVSVQRVKKEEVESKISAWQNAKIAKINNRFKREDAIINGWESEQVQKSTSWMKKVERKLEEKRAKALEKMQNEVAKAHRKAEERRASAEAKRGTKVARVLEICNLMRAVGRAPAKRSFFK
ncbi:remorin-like [Quillaja saponaria]|uniref:Remorin-like n=1 Tax=Quillaja saponaria TaxID=32244 RepID=A0AAD7Q8D2_QUISA|nr:remorin-like [Quillaja saponaria]